MTSLIQTNQFTNRTSLIVGRHNELEFLAACLNDPQCKHYIYYYGRGGIGKTRILEEVLRLVDSSTKHVVTSRILDLYHTETHDPNDIEHIIVSRLDSEGKFFEKYLITWERFQNLIQRGGSPDEIKQERVALTERFIEGANCLAAQVDKIVLLFDTLEQIQLDSSVVEEKIGMANIDPRIRSWMLKTLPQLSNVLVVFAGRPKERLFGETQDPQARLLNDMSAAFGVQFFERVLPPLSLEESRGLIDHLSQGKAVIPPEDVPLINKITGGRPILLHLLFDLFNGLSEQLSVEKELLKRYQDLIDEPDGSATLEKARAEFEQKITSSIYENTGLTGEILSRMAMMPKGVDKEILVKILGLSEVESQEFISSVRRLSFVKTYAASNDAAQERIFLHDEMYRLINGMMRPHNLRTNERAIARNLIDSYYQPRIDEMSLRLKDVNEELKGMTGSIQPSAKNLELVEENMMGPFGNEHRLTPKSQVSAPERNPNEILNKVKKLTETAYILNNQIHKMQIDKFYYQLAQDPAVGYKLYKRLSYQSAMGRIYGYDIPLLDEFLRFYNAEDHRAWFTNVGISFDQVIRESALLWIERFHWCADYSLETMFVEAIDDNPKELYIDRDKHLNLLANIHALADRAKVMLSGFDAEIIKKDELLLEQLQKINRGNEEDLIAIARLCTTIGYTYRSGGKFKEAIPINKIGIQAMASLKDLLKEKAQQDPRAAIDPNLYLGEEIILKNNMAFVQAKQGQFMEANITIRDAHRLSQGQPNLRYSQGLTLTIMASIARLQGKHYDAMAHGREALKIFLELGDHHGLVRSLLNIGSAYRQIAELDLTRNDLDLALQGQENARIYIEKALQIAEDGKLDDQAVGMKAELGKICRGIGKILLAQGKPKEEYTPALQDGEKYFRETLKSSRWIAAERADIREDLAELLYVMGNHDASLKELINVEADLKVQAKVKAGDEIDPKINGWVSLPLGKAECLRYKIAMDKKKYNEAMEYFIFSYIYYYRYSERAHQIQHLIETLFDRYWDQMDDHDRKYCLKQLDELVKLFDGQKIGGVDVKDLVDRLKLLYS